MCKSFKKIFNFNDFLIIAIIYDAEEISQIDLAKKSRLTRAAISKKMKSFLLKNFIVMKPDSTKKKRNLVVLTKSTSKLFIKARELLEENFNAYIPTSFKKDLIGTSFFIHKLAEHFSSVAVENKY